MISRNPKATAASREELASVILNEMYQFAGLIDLEGRILEVNHPALAATGTRREDALGIPCWELPVWKIDPDNPRKIREAYLHALKGKFVRRELFLLGGEEKKRAIYVDFSMKPVRDRSGKIIYLIAEGRDITERKEAEMEVQRKSAELARTNAKLAEMDHLKMEFFSNVSHEFRTPLTLILGPLEQMLEENRLESSQREQLDVMRNNANALLRLVNDLLDISRLDAGKLVPRFSRVDATRVVRLVGAQFESAMRNLGISFEVLGAEPVWAELDVEKVQRIVMNLLSNTMKFVPHGGKVVCSIERRGQFAEIRVEDNGPGIRPEHREIVFERFRQVEGGSTRQFGGTGLGLAIAREFAVLHHGSIGVSDTPGGGATFVVELPLRAPAGTEIQIANDEFATDLKLFVDKRAPPSASAFEALKLSEPLAHKDAQDERPTVLVVEDNSDMRAFIRAQLEPEFRVIVAENGIQGLEQALRSSVDLILSDIMMPLMSGDQMIAEIRRRRELDTVPILLLTAKVDEKLRVELLESSCQDYITKPFSRKELKARVSNWLEVKRARDLLRQELDAKSSDLVVLAKEVSLRRKQLQSALEESRVARVQAEEASAAKSAFLNLISHELNTPLTSMLLALSLIRKRGVPPESEKNIIRLNDALLRLKNLLGTLLEYTKIQSGKLRLEIGPIDLSAVVRDVLGEFLPQAEEKGLEVKLHSEPSSKIVVTDPRLVRIVASNLIGNAIKYTDRGHVEIWLGKRDGFDVIEVSDTGVGISQEAQGRVFEPFEQLSDIRKKNVPGVGLGLTLVQQVVESLGGKISLSSEAGKGSTFEVRLPRR